jgi:hypothetical protein
MKRFFSLLSLLLLAACAPAPNEVLPTLARFPSETAGPAIVMVDQTQAAQLRTPLPATFTPTPSLTPLPPSITASITVTVSVTPSATITDTPTRTPTDLPTLGPEDRPILALAATAYRATVLASDYQIPPFVGVNVTLAPTAQTNPSGIIQIGAQTTAPAPVTGTCPSLPTGGFLSIYQSNPDISGLLGCAVGTAQSIPAASLAYQQGIMLWLNGEILALYNLNDLFQSYPDTFVQGVDPETSSETPPSGLFAPMRGFLKVWSSNQTVRDNLQWATGVEVGATATIQGFANGRMVYLSGRGDVFVFVGLQSGTWLSFQGQY